MENRKTDNCAISWIMPAFNERDNIRRAVSGAVSSLEKLFSTFEVIVVDDGSVDGTHEALREMEREFHNLRVIRHDANQGYGAALMDGFKSSAGDLLFYTDSDNQFVPDEISLLLPWITEFDMVSGYRQSRKDPIQRIFFSAMYNRIVAAMFGVRSKDINCAFKLYRRNVFDQISISSNDFFIDTEILVKATMNGLKTHEIPVSHMPRESGASTVRPGNIFSSLKSLLKLRAEIAVDKGNRGGPGD